MSFAGTVAWMAPEVIKNEPCSEKVDIWSYGIVLWELLTCEIPYRDVDSSAIIWGVGNNNLHLPVPSSCPEGLALLIKQCWSVKPRNRPSFRIILNHLEIAGNELLTKLTEKEYFEAQQEWRKEVQTKMSTVGKNSHRAEQDLIKKRQEELHHAKDIRLAYQRKLEKTNQMCLEVNVLLQQLLLREQEVAEREKLVLQPGYVKNPRKFASSIKKAQDRIYRKYMNNQFQQTAPLPSCSPTEVVLAAEYPKTVQVVTQLDGNDRPRSVVKKVRHRRVGSGTISSPKGSPSRERRFQSEPRNSRLVDSETQTNSDDLVGDEDILGCQDTVDGDEGAAEGGGATLEAACSTPDLLDDQMVSSSEQLELRESSDEDHLEILGRQVSELSERLSLGNSSFKRAYVTETRNGEVTVLRCKSRATNSEGEESWTDEEGESQSDSNYSLRRKR